MLPFPAFVAPDLLSTLAFVGIVAFVGAAFVAGVGEGRRGLALAGVVAWLALTALAPASGLVGLAPATMMAFFVGSNGLGVALAASRVGGWLAARPLWALVGFHAFRLPLEVVLHHWAAIGTIPVDMSWSGRNLDVITGISALVAGVWLYARPGDRVVAWVATLLGLGLLLNVGFVALSCAPVALPFHVESVPPLLLALHAPYAWIVSVCVAGALGGHLVTLRALS